MIELNFNLAATPDSATSNSEVDILRASTATLRKDISSKVREANDFERLVNIQRTPITDRS